MSEGATSVVFAMAKGAAREPTDEDMSNGDAGGDERICEVSFRPRL
jgi:hypothetical protein